jgi:hypothetical protein
MKKRPIYTKQTAQKAVEELVALSKIRGTTKEADMKIDAFIAEHPWSLNLLSVGFAEAEYFAENITTCEGVTIKELPLSETWKKFRANRHIAEQIRFIVYLDDPDHKNFWRRDYRVFSFESFNGTEYFCING